MPLLLIRTDWGLIPVTEKNELQSVAEAVHLAIKLLEDGMRVEEKSYVNHEDFVKSFLYYRSEAVLDELKPAMMILAPYMPHPVGETKEGVIVSNSRSETNYGLRWEKPNEDVRDDENRPSGDERGYLDGTDEQSYSARHA